MARLHLLRALPIIAIFQTVDFICWLSFNNKIKIAVHFNYSVTCNILLSQNNLLLFMTLLLYVEGFIIDIIFEFRFSHFAEVIWTNVPYDIA